MNLYVLGLILTFVAYATYWVSRFLSTKKGILTWDLISKVITIISMWMLGSWTGVWGHAASIFREISVLYHEKVKKKLIGLFIITILIRVAVLMFAYEGFASWMAFITWIIAVNAMWWGNEQQIRFYGIIGNFFYIAFQIMIANWVGMVCEVVVLICNVTSLMYYKKKAKKKTRRKGKKRHAFL